MHGIVNSIILIFSSLLILLNCGTTDTAEGLSHKINFADDTPLIGHRQNYSNTKYCKVESFILDQDSAGFSGELHKTELLNFKEGKIDEQLIFNAAGLLESKQKYLYGRHANLKEIIKFNEYEDQGEKVLFKTDDLGNIFEEQRLVAQDSLLAEKWIYKYAPEQNKIEITTVGSFMHTVVPLKRVYIFDEKYNVTDSSLLSPKDTLLHSQKFTYNAQDLLIHKDELDHTTQVRSVSEYKYDPRQRISEITRFTYNFNEEQHTTLSKTYYSYVDI